MHYRYVNLTLLTLSILFAIYLATNETFHSFLLNLGQWGYIGAFIAGILFVSSFTASTGAVILLVLAEKLSPIEIGLIAGLGAVVGDLAIFKFVKDGLYDEINYLFKHHLGGKYFKKLIRTRYFAWSLPVIGAIIIASPLPDEIGVSLMGISRLNTFTFILLSFSLNAIGIFLVIAASSIFKP